MPRLRRDRLRGLNGRGAIAAAIWFRRALAERTLISRRLDRLDYMTFLRLKVFTSDASK
jgi:hypothetical protein